VQENNLEPDREIVEKVLAGDTNAYAELVRRYERSARAAALGVLRDVHAADDVAQEGFVLAYQKLGRLRAGNCYGPWLLRIVRRQAVRAARRLRPILSLQTVPANVVPASGDTMADGALLDEHQTLLAAVERLPANERTAIVLRYFDGLDARAIATAMGCAEGAIFKRLSRARQRLRQWLTEEDL
jgi:RNA polymerase sigma-70 factor (ECF subfamily)